ncbi:MAG: carboxypeptidase regulatory-like domain-containing protein [Polyangiaceae bacterium]|nr:carboxypeptidase regulatory-like domain-containing protein [Polyangiaceae bacterium]
MSRARLVQRLIGAIAMLACLALLARVVDVGLRPHPFALWAPPPPAEVEERDAEISVTVTGPDDAPISGAEARVFWERGNRFYLAGTGRSDQTGSVKIAGLPRGAAWVVVDAASHARASTRLVLDAGVRVATLKLERASSLKVTVSDEEGAAIPRATVLVTSGDPLPFGALSNDAGVASFNRLPRAPWTVKGSAPGYESVTQSGVTADVTLSLRRLASLEVQVQNADGSPAGGAEVAITGSTLWPARRAETNAAGVTKISGLVAGHFDLRATKGEQVSETLFGYELARGAHAKLTLKLGPGRMVAVSVTDDDADHPSPVGNADVVLSEGGLSSFPIEGRTAGDGSVVLGPISAGAAAVSASAEGFVTRPAVAVPETLEGPVQIQLMRGATLEGEVVDSKGKPVDGASVEVIGIDLFGLPVADSPSSMAFRRTHFEWALAGPRPLIPAGELGVMPGPIPPIPRGVGSPEPTGTPPPAIDPWVTRLDGKFEAHPVTPGRVRALVRHPAYVEGISDPVTVGPGGRAQVKVVLLAGGAIEGRVVDAAGRGVSGARVDLTATRGTLERTTLTATDGSFAFASAPEEVILSVARPDDPSKLVVRKAVEVPEGGRTNVTIELPAPRDSLTVTVLDDSSRPVDAAQVAVLSLDPNSPLRQTVFTSSEGRVTIADARGLELRVVVEAPGFGVAVRQLEKAGEKLEIKLTRGVLVEGRVTTVRGRRSVEGASVTLVSEGRRFVALTDKDGMYRIKDVAVAPVHIVVSHPELATAEATATVSATGRADRAFELPTIDLSEGGGIEGVVLDAAGKPVRGARVAAGVVPAYLPAGTLPSGMATSDAKGRFKLSGVAPGKVDVEAYAPDIGRGIAANVVVQSGRDVTGVTLRLTHAAGDDDPTVSGSVAITLGERGSGDELDVVIVHVADASEAERAGLAVGDVVLAVDGHDVVDMRDARARLSGPVKTDVVVEVDRGGGSVKLRVSREQVRR